MDSEKPESARPEPGSDWRCEGRYPVPQTSPPRQEPMERMTYRCALSSGHDGKCGAEPEKPESAAVSVPKTHQAVGQCLCGSGLACADVAKRALDAARDEQREKDAKLVCVWCKEQRQLMGATHIVGEYQMLGTVHRDMRLCRAVELGIRERK